MTCAETLHEPFETSIDPSARILGNSDVSIDNGLDTLGHLEALINQYMTRDLTFESDALNAFIGILAMFEPVTRHICGHPIMVYRNCFPSDSVLLASLSWSIGGEAWRWTEFPS